ncbi:MAG: glucose-6-phosphate isomerase [Gaiellaceae bacterium]
MAAVAQSELVRRIWQRDPSVWTASGEEKWLGWLEAPWRAREQAAALADFAQRAVADVEHVVLLGMGGSSLAPEVLRRAFDVHFFTMLDTTHPVAVRRLSEWLDPGRTLYVVSSKSGSTIETRSHLEHFWALAEGRGELFVAVTDPGSDLERLARERGFRAVFAGEPTIGGRYSALSVFGTVPAALMGIDLERLLGRAIEMAEACRGEQGNPGLELGLELGEAWREGRDKVCIPLHDSGFSLWTEQLIAESTGKHGKGLIPAPGESISSNDRQAVDLRLGDPYEVAQEFFRFEFAVAVAGSAMGINPFDQPNVQEAKDRTNAILASGEEPSLALESGAKELFSRAQPGDYVAIQAFVDPSPDNERKLLALVERARAATGCVVTWGFGPRYLHSTGQLHKGGPPSGLFLQVVDEVGGGLPIPGKSFTFGQLIHAQAAGDYAALKERGLRVARIDLESL